MGIICACMPSIRSLLRNFSSTTKNASAASSVPKIQNIANQNGSGPFHVSNKPVLDDGESFVQLLDLDSKRGSKIGYAL
jgi:hypothetical protein